MKKGLFRVLLALIFVTGVVTFSFAANKIELKTTIPPIPKSECERAGTISLQMDDGTKMLEGDVIEFTLSNGVTICRTIDFFLKLTDVILLETSNNAADPVHDTDTMVAAGRSDNLSTTDVSLNPILFPQPQPADPVSLSGDGGNYDFGFLVRGSYATNKIYLTLGRRHTTTGIFTSTGRWQVLFDAAQPSTRLIIDLFDEKINANFFWYDNNFIVGDPNNTVATMYDPLVPARGRDYLNNSVAAVPFLKEHNVLCINTKNYSGSTVLAYGNSKPRHQDYALTFSEDNTIAVLVDAEEYLISNACEKGCPTIALGTVPGQNPGDVIPVTPANFDPGNYNNVAKVAGSPNYRWTSVGTCATKYAQGIKISKKGAKMPANTPFKIRLTLLLDGNADQGAAVWSGMGVGVHYADDVSNQGICMLANDPINVAGPATVWNLKNDAKNRPVILETNAFVFGAANVGAIVLDLPQVNLLGNVAVNQTIQVKAQLVKDPCGIMGTFDACLVTFVPNCGVAVGRTNLLFPYAVGADVEGWWTGIVVTNLDATDGVAKLKMYDRVGGTATIDLPVTANSHVVTTLSELKDDIVGALNHEETLYITVECNFAADGLLLIGSAYGEPNGLLYGMLPRK